MNRLTVKSIVDNNTINKGTGFFKYPTPNQSRRETWQELVNLNRGTTINSANGRGNPLYSPNPTQVTVGAPSTKLKIYQDKHKESANKLSSKNLVSRQSAKPSSKTSISTTKSASTNKVKINSTPQTKSVETSSTTVQSTANPANSIKVLNAGNKRPTINWNDRAKLILGEDLNGDGVIDSKDVSWLLNLYNLNKSALNNAGYQTISDGNYSIDGKIGNTTKNLWEWYKQNRAKVSQTADTTPVQVETPLPVLEDYVSNGYRTITYGNRSYSVPTYTTTDTPISV